MAYVRKRGNQLAIVHGQRDPETRKVNQRVLFTLYSQAEAREALDESGECSHYFRSLLEMGHPEISFDWKKIASGIASDLDMLPATYDYQENRLRARFRSALCSFTRELLLADPQLLYSAAEILIEQRHALEYLGDLLRWRLSLAEQEENEWNQDNAFFWRYNTRGREVPVDAEERLATLYERGDYDRAEALARLLIESFENYAEGYNYLGLVAYDLERVDEAIKYFEQTMTVGRRKFPKRFPKRDYWSDLDTRPYIRGMRNLTLAMNDAGRFEEALELCDRLHSEIGDDISAACFRASVALNLGQWKQAAEAAEYTMRIHPSEALIAALAWFELGEKKDALTRLLLVVLNRPRAVRAFFGLPSPTTPPGYTQAGDHNAGVGLFRQLHAYRKKRSLESEEFFDKLLTSEQVLALFEEVETLERQWEAERQNGDRTAFDRLHHIQSYEYACERADELHAVLLPEAAPHRLC